MADAVSVSMGPGRSPAQRVSRPWSVRAWRASRRTGGACTTIGFSVFIARDACLHRGIPRDLQLAHHLDGAVRSLGDGRGLTRQYGPRGDLRVDGVGLAGGASRALVAPIHFYDTMPRSAHRTCQAGAIAAGAFDAERFNPPVGLGPRDQRLVAARVSDEHFIA